MIRQTILDLLIAYKYIADYSINKSLFYNKKEEEEHKEEFLKILQKEYDINIIKKTPSINSEFSSNFISLYEW